MSKRKLNEEEKTIVRKQIKNFKRKAEESKPLMEYYEIHIKHSKAITDWSFIKLNEKAELFFCNEKQEQEIQNNYEEYVKELSEWYKNNENLKVELTKEQYKNQKSMVERDLMAAEEVIKELNRQILEGVDEKEEEDEQNRQS